MIVKPLKNSYQNKLKEIIVVKMIIKKRKDVIVVLREIIQKLKFKKMRNLVKSLEVFLKLLIISFRFIWLN